MLPLSSPSTRRRASKHLKPMGVSQHGGSPFLLFQPVRFLWQKFSLQHSDSPPPALCVATRALQMRQ